MNMNINTNEKYSLHVKVVVTGKVCVQDKFLGPMRYSIKQYILQQNTSH